MKFAVASFLIVLLIIAVGFAYFERMLTRMKQSFGLIMPAAFFVLSILAVIQSVPTVIDNIEQYNSTAGAAIVSLLASFVLINIPTIWVYVVHVYVCRKSGLTPWPFHSKQKELPAQTADDSSDSAAQ